ncbi:MAG TPA: YggS family pyridoxal phosphate-dependent enzyme [Candidatus Limnocylindrales bacterium]|nr:YggS family pyridoxal phosphate-dependent enzyme [Candidatus Limnocylindrales bacterium]
MAVTKTVEAARIRAAAAAGFTRFAENRVQERQAKAGELNDLGAGPIEAAPIATAPIATAPSGAGPTEGAPTDAAPIETAPVDAVLEERPRGITWDLVGPLQSNKARRAIELFDVIQSVDSLELAQRLDRIAAEVHPGSWLRVLLQVNVDDDPAKAGFDPATLEHDLAAILELAALRVEGLMTVGRLVDSAEAARPTFLALRTLSERLRARHRGLGDDLSMGMSDDYPVAVEEGATIVRLGRAIFGARPAAR